MLYKIKNLVKCVKKIALSKEKAISETGF